MIAKIIERKAANDNYKALANYINDAKSRKPDEESGEKVLVSWHEGCNFDEYDLAVKEAEAVQAMNTRSKRAKTFHLVISFRPEDEAKLTPEIYKNIEKEIAAALGFENHQRHCGVHKNTNNVHLHIAYNMINPKKYNRYEPYQSKRKILEVCRNLEKKYGLTVDNGMEAADNSKEKVNAKAKNLEAHRQEQSFNSYILSKKEYIFNKLAVSANWAEFQIHLARVGIEAKLRGRGLIFKDINGKSMIKGSDIDRGLSLDNLTKKIGYFIENLQINSIEINVIDKYKAKPIHKGSENSSLYEEFQRQLAYRNESLDDIKRTEAEAYRANRTKWSELMEGTRTGKNWPVMNYQQRRRLEDWAKAKEAAELTENRKKLAEARKKIREEIPYTSWSKFLTFKADNGDEEALAYLRSKSETGNYTPEKIEAVSTEFDDRRLKELEIDDNIIKKQEELSKNGLLNSKQRKVLGSALKMEQVINKINLDSPSPGKRISFKSAISNRGSIIYNFNQKHYGTIRDNGQEIFFSNSNDCQVIAEKYAAARWGKNIEVRENKFCLSKSTKAQNLTVN
ncbi:MAG: relaxase/mobilization nuclease domain-containing protein [Deltaproteobacteria bacterium]|jgi:hypothetical protein|nr:relaxase/mobilization nuclease domain-containing protein [Deltaproteobacteria bacterium]